MDFEIRVTRNIDSFLAFEKEWDEMVVDLFGGHPFLRHFWFVNYYRSYFPGVPIFIVTAHHQNKIVGAVPMIVGNRRMGGIPLKELRLLAGDHSHLNRLLVSLENKGLAAKFFEIFLGSKTDLIYLEDLPDCFPDRTWIKEFCGENRLLLETRIVRSSPFIPTVGDFDDYRRRLSKKFRELLNNRINRINRAGGYRIRTFGDLDNIEIVLEDLQNISAGSWQTENNSGLFSGENNSRFYRNHLRHSLENGYGAVSILYFKEKPAAFEIHMIHNGTEYCLKAEYSREFEKVSPGAVLDLELVKKAFESDIEVYDLLGYTDNYKLRWTKNSTPYFRYFIFNRTVAAKAAYTLYYRIGNRLRELRKTRKQS